MEDNFAIRLKLFMDSVGIASTQFADMCEIPRPSFSQLLSGRNQKVSDVLIKKIHTAFPELSIIWLMFGEGEMTTSSSIANSEESSSQCEKNVAEISQYSGNTTSNCEDSNLRGLTMPEDMYKKTMIQQLEENKKIIDLQMQIENMQKNPRRVTQITVYYDDSTFETFIPSR